MSIANNNYSYGCINYACRVLLEDLNNLSKELSFYVEDEKSELHSKALSYLKKSDDLIKIVQKIKDAAVE